MSLDWAGTYDLLDLEISRSGDGRTVVGLAAVWETPTKVNDHYGEYMESISRSAFDKTIRERGDRPFPVYYNHGFTAAGTPSDAYSVPIGRSIMVRADKKGLYTESRYNKGEDADRVLEAIRNGAITAQSFRGKVYKSNPDKVPRRSPGGPLPSIIRTELGLSEYGPTPSAVYRDAAILAVRSQAGAVAAMLRSGFDLDQLLELARTSTTPEEPETPATSEPEAGTDEPGYAHSSRLAIRRARARAEMILSQE